MKRFVPPPHPPEWINTDEELPDKPLDMNGFFIIDVPPRPGIPADEDEKTPQEEEAEAIFDQIANEWWKHGPGTK